MLKSALLLLALLLAACAGPAAVPTPTPVPTPTAPPTAIPPCAVLAADYLADHTALIDRWRDAATLADSTARVALAGPIADLQAIRRELLALEPPDCARVVHLSTERYMTHLIESLLMFMRDEPRAAVTDEIILARDQLDLMKAELAAIEATSPTPASATRTSPGSPPLPPGTSGTRP